MAIYMPKGIYFNIDSRNIFESVKMLMDNITDYDNFIKGEVNSIGFLLHDNLSLMFIENDSCTSDKNEVLITVEKVIGEHIKHFEFRLDDQIKGYRISKILEKHKIKSNNALIDELIKLT